jgi:hypothetical protein
MGNMPRNETSWMEKDKDLQEIIETTYFAYARQLKMAWDVKNWDRKSIKMNHIEKSIIVLDFHESKMIYRK